MKLGRMFHCSLPPDEVKRALERERLEAVEYALPIEIAPLSAAQWRNVVEMGARGDVPISLHEVISLAYASENHEMREGVRERLEQDIHLASEAGAGVLTIHTTCTRTVRSLEAIWQNEQTLWLARALDREVTPEYEESVDAMIALLRWAAPIAARGGVKIAVENNFREPDFFGRRIDSVMDVIDVLARANAPATGLCFDIYKSYTTERSIGESIRLCAPWILDVHASDIRHTDTAFFRPRYPIGEGLIDWEDALGALLEIGYEGPVILEMIEGEEGIKAARAHFARVRERLAAARSRSTSS